MDPAEGHLIFSVDPGQMLPVYRFMDLVPREGGNGDLFLISDPGRIGQGRNL